MISRRSFAEDKYLELVGEINEALKEDFHPVFGFIKKWRIREKLRRTYMLDYRWGFGRSNHVYLARHFEIKTGWIVIPGLPTSRFK